MPGHLLLKNCLEDEVTRPAIERALTQDTLLWLDLPDTSPDTLALLSEVFKIHPLAVEDAHEFNFLAALDDRIDELQDKIFAKPTDQELAALFSFGLGTEVTAVVLLLFMFRRRGWL